MEERAKVSKGRATATKVFSRPVVLRGIDGAASGENALL